MKVVKKEYHQVISSFEYDIPEEDIINTFGSVERFREIVSHNSSSDDWDYEPTGEEPTDEESDKFYDFMCEYDYDREDDWWTDRKGGYEVTYELGEDE